MNKPTEPAIEFRALGKKEMEFPCELSIEGEMIVIKIPSEPQYSWGITLDAVKEAISKNESK